MMQTNQQSDKHTDQATAKEAEQQAAQAHQQEVDQNAIPEEAEPTLTALIIDDEAAARSELHFLLDETGRLAKIEEAGSAREGVEKIISFRPDVLFLDINMPKTSGLTIAEGLTKVKHPPVVVFVTAYSEYALKAFNVDAVDYLLKPVETDRLETALNRVEKRLAERQAIAAAPKLPVKKSGKRLFLPLADIYYIEAKDDYASVHTKENHYLYSSSLSALEEVLDPKIFFRVHRGFIANLRFVSKLDTTPNGSVFLELEGQNVQIPVSRRRVTALRHSLEIQRRKPRQDPKDERTSPQTQKKKAPSRPKRKPRP